jgi:hypothetical protein
MWTGIGAIGPVLAAAIVGTDRRIRNQLVEADALDPAPATAIATGSPLIRWRLSRLTSVGAVHVVASGCYHLDEAGWLRYRGRRRRNVRVAVVILVAILGFLWWTDR